MRTVDSKREGSEMAVNAEKRGATQQDIARLASVSRATVSAVINSTRYVLPETKARVLAAIKELEYVPNAIARSLKTDRTMMIGLMLPNILSPVWSSIARGVEDVAREGGFAAVIIDTDEQPDILLEGMQRLVQSRVDGIVLAPCGNRLDTLGRFATGRSTAMVLVDRYFVDSKNSPSGVTADNENATYEATRHLIDVGSERIGMVALSLQISTGLDRLEGYKRALCERGKSYDEGLVVIGGRGERDGYDATRRLMALRKHQRPDALVVCSHLMTVGALRAMRDMGLRVPEDVALIGYDELPWAGFMDPPLTVVEQPTYEMGERAARMLVARIQGMPEQGTGSVVLPTRLVHRQSCCSLRETPSEREDERRE